MGFDVSLQKKCNGIKNFRIEEKCPTPKNMRIKNCVKASKPFAESLVRLGFGQTIFLVGVYFPPRQMLNKKMDRIHCIQEVADIFKIAESTEVTEYLNKAAETLISKNESKPDEIIKDENGWFDEEGESMLPDEYDIEDDITVIDNAYNFLKKNYATWAEYISNITAHAYKDENSFFTSFIDRYYNFTFINLYNMMAQDNDFDVAYFEGTRDHESWYKSGGSIKSDPKTDTVPNQLSNKSDFRGSLSYISNYYMKSNQGKIMMNIPSTEHIYYYDYNISNETS